MVSHTTWFLEQIAMAYYICGIFNVPGFQLDYVIIDIMHCLDLGVTQVLLGNVLYELFIMMGGLVTRPAPTLANLTIIVHTAARAIGQ